MSAIGQVIFPVQDLLGNTTNDATIPHSAFDQDFHDAIVPHLAFNGGFHDMRTYKHTPFGLGKPDIMSWSSVKKAFLDSRIRLWNNSRLRSGLSFHAYILRWMGKKRKMALKLNTLHPRVERQFNYSPKQRCFRGNVSASCRDLPDVSSPPSSPWNRQPIKVDGKRRIEDVNGTI